MHQCEALHGAAGIWLLWLLSGLGCPAQLHRWFSSNWGESFLRFWLKSGNKTLALWGRRVAERGKVLGVTCATGAEAEEAYSSTKEIVDYKRFSDSDSVLLLLLGLLLLSLESLLFVFVFWLPHVTSPWWRRPGVPYSASRFWNLYNIN